MLIIGLTGGYCTGKNEVAAMLEERGWRVADVDKLGHAALSGASGVLAKAFGAGILSADGSVDRKKLGHIVFADERQLKKLESIVHPAMYSLLDREIEAAAQASIEKFCINAALLYRFPQVPSCRAIIEVRAPLHLRLARAQERDHIAAAEALKRIASQRSFWDMRPASIPVYMLWNTASHAELRAGVDGLLRNIESQP